MRCFLSRRLSKSSNTSPLWRFLGPCAHHLHHHQQQRNSNNSMHLSLFFFVSCFFFEMLVWWCILYRYASTNRRPYAQQPLHRAAFMRRCSYAERFVQRNFYTGAFTHRGFHAKKLVHTETFTHRCFTQRCFCTAQHLRTDASQTRLHTDAFTDRSSYTEKPLGSTCQPGKTHVNLNHDKLETVVVWEQLGLRPKIG